MSPIQLEFRGEKGTLAYQTMFSAGVDLCAQPANTPELRKQLAYAEGMNPDSEGRWVLRKGDTVKIPTGVFIVASAKELFIPANTQERFDEEKRQFALSLFPVAAVLPRSGLSARGIVAHTGTVDQDFRGEICVLLTNFSNEQFEIKIGDRIAQLVGYLSVQMGGVEVKNKERGTGGFGSTGV